MLNKNDELVLTVSAMGSDGEGIARREDGFTIFIKDALPGDTIRAKIIKSKPSYAFARLMEILTPSPDRVEPRCSCARACGGCQIQHLSYEKQLEYKADKVNNNLMRIGGIAKPPMEPIIGMTDPWRYRNKAQYPVGQNRDGDIITGFFAGRTHSIIPMPEDDCLLEKEINRQILGIVKAYMKKAGVTPYDEVNHKGLVRHVLTRCGFATGEIMVCLIINGTGLPREEILVEELKNIPGMTSIMININRERTNVILGPQVKTLWGQPFITDYIGDVRFEISPQSFYQVNPVQTKKLYDKALEYAAISENDTVWDIYCGIGTISLFLARQAGKVYGVEIVPAAIEDARRNAAINGITNAEFFVGRAEEVLPREYKEHSIRADVMVVDPPRKGCERAVLDTMLAMAPERIVYVSCDSATLARDLRILIDGGYTLKKVCPVDQFGHSAHVETVCSLHRIEKKNM